MKTKASNACGLPASLRPGASVPRDGERGATLLAVAYSMAGMAAVAALAINVGQLMVTQAELQTVADFAAKSAAQELARVYLTTGRSDPLVDGLTSAEFTRIANAATQRALKNTAGSVAISINPGDVGVGKWKDANGAFSAGSMGVDTVSVVARRDGLANGLVDLLLPGLLGQAQMGLHAAAASRLSGIRYAPPGTADFPVGIGKAWFARHESPCMVNNNRITLYPTDTADSCAGWHTFEDEPASAARLSSILKGLRNHTWTSPAINVNDTKFIFSGGTVANSFRDLEDLYNARKNANGEMSVLIPVYDREDCGNPQGWMRIIGVARAVITKVISGSNKYIEARVECDVVKNVESGGTDYGVLAAGPDIVH